MSLFNFNLLNETESDGLEQFQSSFPLFNPDALREINFNAPALGLGESFSTSEVIEETLSKKIKTNENTELKVKTRGRKAIPKNAKHWEDPLITLKEIIENDLAGEPTEREVKSKAQRLQKMRDAKAKKRAEKKGLLALEDKEDVIIAPAQFKNTLLAIPEPLTKIPQLVFKDGKLVIEAPQVQNQAPLLVEIKKPFKLTSMSFRTKNHTAKWTEEETKKFYKSLEIFGADFSMIAKLFPTRNRDQLKNKFNKEEKTNSKLIDKAFERNKLLGKRSIMDRIRTFNKALEARENFSATTNTLDGLPNAFNKLERNYSNNSTDSMDLRIMDEIQDLFVKEIMPKKMLTASLGTFEAKGQELAEVTNVDNFFEFGNTNANVYENPTAWASNEKNDETAAQKRERLLSKLLM